MAKSKSKKKTTTKAAAQPVAKTVVKKPASAAPSKPVKADAKTAADDYVVLDLTSLAVPVAILIGSLIIAVALFFALKGTARTDDNGTVTGTPTTVTGPYGQYSQYIFDVSGVTLNTKDDPVKGDKNAKVTLLEWSDYECPFCQRHFKQVDPEIKKNFVDQGKVKQIFKDFVAVTGHNPAAQTEALAAACADDQGKFWQFHDEIFNGTVTNGGGYKNKDGSTDSMADLAKSLKLDVSDFKACLTGRKFNANYEKDNQEIRDLVKLFPASVQQEGLGTPTFMIYKSDNSSEITVITGALPYDAFEQVINKYLNK